MALTDIDLPDIGLPCTLTPLACILVTGIAVSDIAMSDIMIADITATGNLFPDQHRLKELLDRFSSIQDEKDQLSAPLGQLKEGDQKKNSELEKERAEVARLKEELEGLKIQHGKELSLATESAKKEVAALKEEHARELAEGKNNWRTEVKTKDQVIEAIKHLRDLMEE
ncbi:hypothetical protein QYE76_037151 [Lolium multiflorum]|uniref:Uncharacterized protein n=1 Tax=Lolium multiflorum TaxID=4521 RepID=A0AAD8QK96_LOLMU|nr:hypothetical protein QYE76_037151 [Lolium multiflorum]